VKVVYANTKSGQKTELAADYVVICMPLSVLPAWTSISHPG
jgi:hypothetical protein